MVFYREVRSPVVAGTFYPEDPDTLRKAIEESFLHSIGPGGLPSVSSERVRESSGFVVPHAGYIYSGPVAAHTYYQLALEGKPDTFVVIGPNHTGYGALVSVYPRGKWSTPLGVVDVDEELARNIITNSGYAELDYGAHVDEHSIEVQLPFLQYLYGEDFMIVPIVLALQTPDVARDLAKAIYDAATHLGRDIVVLASSDFTHYEPHESAVKKDLEAIKKVEELDTDGFYKVIRELNVSTCGPGGIMVAIEYTKLVYKENARAKLLKYATSGDTSGYKAAVVGYASIRFYKA